MNGILPIKKYGTQSALNNFEANEVYIPNEEVRGEFRNAVEGADWDIVMELIADSEKLLEKAPMHD